MPPCARPQGRLSATCAGILRKLKGRQSLLRPPAFSRSMDSPQFQPDLGLSSCVNRQHNRRKQPTPHNRNCLLTDSLNRSAGNVTSSLDIPEHRANHAQT